jgi:hypothetical protein
MLYYYYTSLVLEKATNINKSKTDLNSKKYKKNRIVEKEIEEKKHGNQPVGPISPAAAQPQPEAVQPRYTDSL